MGLRAINNPAASFEDPYVGTGSLEEAPIYGPDPGDVPIAFTVVAGGGGGGAWLGCGGGGGGMVEWRAYMVTGTSYSIVVGDGGQGAWGPSTPNPYFGGPGGAGYPGGNSSLQFFNQYSGAPYTLTAYGGGGGGGLYDPNPGTYSPGQVPGGAGGSGGG